ncbi:uncharacterized protein [Spinacia oleracea]|uniref:FBD domain-containing protein n=1 Tax=Spinacia oleracea TaxID=3562 RepID=A0A9R0IQ40_SPIOL|nr:uncharacterized protein LOC110793002 [Spinacia oleracea]
MDIYSGEWILIDAPCLAKVSFIYLDGTQYWYHDSHVVHQPPLAFDFLKSNSVTYLSLQGYSLELVAANRMPAAYPDLELLELDWCPVLPYKEMIGFFDNTPRLHTVIFRQGLIKHSDQFDCQELEQWPLKYLGVATLFSLYVEVIQVHNFSGNKGELILLEYLLYNAVELKWLVLYKDCNMKMEQELRMAEELLRISGTSDHCRVELL